MTIEIVLVLFGVANVPSASPEFSPDLEQLGNVTNYRKGIPWLKKESGELLEQLLDSVHF